MKKYLTSGSIIVAAAVLLSGCASTTLIRSNPSGADVYVNSQKKGTTPYSYSDTKIVGSSTNITLKKEGYQDFNVTLVRNEKADVGAIIGGCFFLVPFLWTMKYDTAHNYEMTAAAAGQNTGDVTGKDKNYNSTEELIKLQTLLEQKAITKDDFTTLKVKILNSNYDYGNSIADQIAKLKGLLEKGLLTQEEYTSQKNKLVNGK